MSFSLIGPFSFGAKVSSAQFNQLDADHANAFDKSAAGDAFEGEASFSGGHLLLNATNVIRVNTSGAVEVNAAAGIESNISNGIRPTVTGGILSGVGGGIKAALALGISPGVAGGIGSDIAGGIAPTVAAGIRSSIVGGITAGVAGGITSGAPGGFRLTGGTTDWVGFDAPRTRAVAYPLPILGTVDSSPDWQIGTYYLSASATTTQQNFMLPFLHNGATLNSLDIVFLTATHVALPAVLPKVRIQRLPIAAGTDYVSGVQTLSSAAFQSPTPANVTVWNASGQLQTMTYTCNQNNVVDTSAYVYMLQLIDENGANSVSGNKYFAAVPSYSVPDMRFQ